MTETAAGPTVEKLARDIVLTLQRAGHDAVWAGGCVRDRVMARKPKDFDVATSARPEQIEQLFPHTRPVGKSFGVILVIDGHHAVEVATFRRDFEYRDGRRPERVEFTTDREDAARRDFTINGIFYDPVRDAIRDYVGGIDDIGRRIIRTIGDPDDRFREDYLRLFRAVRFASVLEFEIEARTFDAIRLHANRIGQIAHERIQQELTRLLMESPRPSVGIRLLDRSGLLQEILPEISALKGVEQPPQFHPEGDVFEHTMIMLDEVKERTPALLYAVLFHDVGKPPTFRRTTTPEGTERIRFDGHDRVGAEMTESIMQRLRFSNEMIETVSHCVRNHMRFISVPEMRNSTLRQLVGAPTFPIEIELHRVDCKSSHGDLSNFHFLREFQEKLKSEPVLPAALVSGHDVMSLGVPEGREVGVWRKKAYEAQLEGRFEDRAGGLEWLRQQLGKASSS